MTFKSLRARAGIELTSMFRFVLLITGTKMQACILCGALGHNSEACPWEEAFEKPLHIPVLIVLSLIASIISILSAIATIILIHDVQMTSWQIAWTVFWMFSALTVGSSFATIVYKQKFWRLWIALWKYRNIDPDICECGSKISSRGPACAFTKCLSVKEKLIRRATK
jgi:hypothetical protein